MMLLYQHQLLLEIKKIRDIVHKFQKNFAYNPPKKFSGSILMEEISLLFN